METWCRWLFARGSEKPKALIRFQKFPLKILNMRKRLDILDRKEDILEWINNQESNAEIARRLGCKVQTLNRYYKKLDISYSGNQGASGHKTIVGKKSALELLANINISNSRKRRRLIEDGIKENKCECCGLSEWMGRPIPLELHHIDFNHYNNDLSNIQILCANCHMQAHNYSNTREAGATG
jgi:transposase-like protein